MEPVEHSFALTFGYPGARVIDSRRVTPTPVVDNAQLPRTRPPRPLRPDLHAFSMSTPARRSTRAGCAWTSSRPLPLWAKDSSTPCADAKAANRPSTHPLHLLADVRQIHAVLGCGGSSSARANQSKSSTILPQPMALSAYPLEDILMTPKVPAWSVKCNVYFGFDHRNGGYCSSWEASAVNFRLSSSDQLGGADARRPTAQSLPEYHDRANRKAEYKLGDEERRLDVGNGRARHSGQLPATPPSHWQRVESNVRDSNGQRNGVHVPVTLR